MLISSNASKALLSFSAAAILLAAAPRVARADEEHGLTLGLRTGFAWPFGRIKGQQNIAPVTFGSGTPTTQDVDFGDSYVGMVPVWLDAGYRFTRGLSLGAYFQYGFAFPGGATCPSGASCSGADYRVGIRAEWSITPQRSLKPWLAVGFGYEVATFSGTQGDTTVDQALHGVELFELEAGVDAKPVGGLHVGPFLSVSFAQFTGFSSTLNGDETTGALSPTAPHLWLMLGARAHYDL